VPEAARGLVLRPLVLTAFAFRPLEQADAEAVASWRYPEPYAFYDWPADPDDLAELLDPEARRRGGYHAVEGDDGELIGFATCSEAAGVAELGLGLRPDHTGRGLGGAFLTATLDWATERYAPTEFSLSVAAFNRRAIIVYERAGFEAVRTYRHRTNGAEWDFVELRRPA
jgi:ribosomal-protein-alanine N-acetyltransferase